MKVILWTGNETQADELRQAIRAQGHACLIRNAGVFAGLADAEKCDAIAFHQANRDPIIAAYRSESYVERFGHVDILNLEFGPHGEPISIPTLPPPPPPPKTEADYLDERLDNLSDDDLRTYIRGKTGADAPADATRAELEAILRPGTVAAVETAENSVSPPVKDAATETSPPPPPPPQARGRRTQQ